jgi:hypothetical protein
VAREAIVRVGIEFDWEDMGAIGLSAVGKLVIPPVPAKPPTANAIALSATDATHRRKGSLG